MNDLNYKLSLMWAYKDAVRTRVPVLFQRMIHQAQKRNRRAAARMAGKECIEVAFLLTIPGMWKLDYFFRLLQQNDRYHPYVVIYPYSHYKGFSHQELWETVERTKQFITQRGFEYVVPYNEATNRWDNIRKTLNPDIVFFTTPYRDILPQYYVYNFKEALTCYVPYAFQAMNVYPLNYDQIAINLFGINFAETSMHLEFARKYSRSKGANFAVSGYPGIEVYFRKDYNSPDVWKPQSSAKKRVIWAPHHTIDGTDDFQVSTFLLYYDKMLDLAERYKESIQFAFKPHQLLKFKLQKIWGTERTEEYYNRWKTLPNGQLEEAGYVDLFIHSDAMIHDSGSFTTEYLCLNKPVAYLVKDRSPRQQFNDFGAMAFDQHYHVADIDAVEHFLTEVVLKGIDSISQQRETFVQQYLSPHDGMLPSQRMLTIIENMINKKTL